MPNIAFFGESSEDQANEFKEIEGDIYYYSLNNEEFITEKAYWGYSLFNNYTDARYYLLLKEKAEKQKSKDIKRQLKEWVRW